MTKIIWIIFALFVIGNSFFVLPFHLTEDSVISNHATKYKKDSVFLREVFHDSIITLKLKLPPLYESLYYNATSTSISGKKSSLLVNVSFLDNLDFFSLIFPFYKTTNLKGEISFYSAIKAEGQPGRDSIALIGNITMQVRISVMGICTPQYARTLMEKEFVHILRKEMSNIEIDINRRTEVDTISLKIPDNNHVRKRSEARKRS